MLSVQKKIKVKGVFSMKKIALVLTVVMISLGSFSAGYAYYGYSNMGYYPSFDAYLPFNPTRAEVGEFVDRAKEYIDACDNDIETIRNARNDAVDRANDAIRNFNMSVY